MIAQYLILIVIIIILAGLIAIGSGMSAFSVGMLWGVFVGGLDMLAMIFAVRRIFDVSKKKSALFVTLGFFSKFILLAFIFYLLIVILRVDPLGLLTGFTLSLISLIVTGISCGIRNITDRKET